MNKKPSCSRTFPPQLHLSLYPLHWWWLEIAHDEFFIVCRAWERLHAQALLNYKQTTKNTRQHKLSTGQGKRPHAQALLNLIKNTSTRIRKKNVGQQRSTSQHMLSTGPGKRPLAPTFLIALCARLDSSTWPLPGWPECEFKPLNCCFEHLGNIAKTFNWPPRVTAGLNCTCQSTAKYCIKHLQKKLPQKYTYMVVFLTGRPQKWLSASPLRNSQNWSSPKKVQELVLLYSRNSSNTLSRA